MSPSKKPRSISPKLLLVLLLAPTTLAATACKSSTEPDDADGDQMTQNEANSLAQALFGGELQTFGDDLSAQDLLPGVTVPTESTIPCQGGGQATFSGQVTGFVNAAQDSLGMRLSGVLIPTACVVTGDGVVFTLDGMPGIEQEGSVSVALSTFTTVIDFTAHGTVNWTSGTRAGTCGVDTAVSAVIQPSLDPDDPPPTATVTGSLCGRTIDRTIVLPFTTEG